MLRRVTRSLVLLPVLLVLSLSTATADALPEYGISWIRELGFNHLLMPRHAEQRSSPLVQGNTIYLGTRLGDVWSFDRRRGGVNWKRSFDSPIDADLATEGQTLYAGTVSGAVIALDREQGTTRWRYWAGHEVQGAPTVADDLLLFTTANNQVFALDRESGEWQWQYSEGPDPDLSIQGVAGVAVSGDAVFTGFSNGVLVALGREDGTPLWRQRFEGTGQFQDIDATPVLSGGRLYVVVYGSRLVAMEPADGSVLWSRSISSKDAPVVVDDTVFLGTLNGEIHALDAATGDSRWTVTVSEAPLPTPLFSQNRLYVPDGSRGLAVLDAGAGKRIWHYQGAVSGIRSSPAVDAHGGIYMATNLGHLYRFHPIRSLR